MIQRLRERLKDLRIKPNTEAPPHDLSRWALAPVIEAYASKPKGARALARFSK